MALLILNTKKLANHKRGDFKSRNVKGTVAKKSLFSSKAYTSMQMENINVTMSIVLTHAVVPPVVTPIMQFILTHFRAH